MMLKAGQNVPDFAGRNRLAIKIPLNLDTALEIEAAHLLLGLYTFGGRRHSKADAKTRDRANDGKAALVDQQVAHERLVDLDLVERETAQIADTGITGAEIVHRNANTQFSQLVQNSNVPFRFFQQHRLGDLQFQPRCRKTRSS